MCRRRLPPPLRRPERPQHYENRIEIAIEALGHALSACGKLTAFMLAEQTFGWPRYDLVDAAAGELRKAQKWLAKQRSRTTGR
ncbi:MAG: hypothetical protein NTW87_07200 [Planctomycetota bacterium]|nr:hypothetical protein [Planctomycetota bacterium]